MWMCDNCQEINDDDKAQCSRCSRAKTDDNDWSTKPREAARKPLAIDIDQTPESVEGANDAILKANMCLASVTSTEIVFQSPLVERLGAMVLGILCSAQVLAIVIYFTAFAPRTGSKDSTGLSQILAICAIVFIGALAMIYYGLPDTLRLDLRQRTYLRKKAWTVKQGTFADFTGLQVKKVSGKSTNYQVQLLWNVPRPKLTIVGSFSKPLDADAYLHRLGSMTGIPVVGQS